MVMAAGTANTQAQEGLGEDIDLVMDPVSFFPTNIHRGMGRLSEMPEAGTLDRLIGFLSRIDPGVFKEVSCEVLHDPLIVGDIGVEAPDHIVPVSPCLGDGVVGLVPLGLCKPHQVQPVLPPVLSVVRRLQQAVDQVSEGLRRIVLKEAFKLFGAGWQPCKRIKSAPGKNPL